MEIAVESPEIVKPEKIADPVRPSVSAEAASDPASPHTAGPSEENPAKVSALSLKSIRAKRELEQQAKAAERVEGHLPSESFSETDMLVQWTRYAQRLADKGQKIMESLMLMSDPKLEGTTIVHELPNEGTKIDFESGKGELLG